MTAASDPTPAAMAAAKRQKRNKIIIGVAAAGGAGTLVWILTKGKVKIPVKAIVATATEQVQVAAENAVEAGTSARNSPVAHMVAGHVRKQPYGPGRTLVRDVVVDGYMRGGAAAA